MIISREKAGFEHDEEAMNAAVREDIMLHACIYVDPVRDPNVI